MLTYVNVLIFEKPRKNNCDANEDEEQRDAGQINWNNSSPYSGY